MDRKSEGEIMGKRIAVVGTGALGGYVGGYLAHHGEDVTLIDMWPENIEAIRERGLELDGVTPEEKFTVRTAKTMQLARTPIRAAIFNGRRWRRTSAKAAAPRSIS